MAPEIAEAPHSSVREKLDKLPRLLRRSMTWATGIPAQGEVVRRRSETTRIAQAVVFFLVGVLLGVAGLPVAGVSGLVIVLLSWTLTIGAARDL